MDNNGIKPFQKIILNLLEPCRQKTCLKPLQTIKVQISVLICTVLSLVSLLFAAKIFRSIIPMLSESRISKC